MGEIYLLDLIRFRKMIKYLIFLISVTVSVIVVANDGCTTEILSSKTISEDKIELLHKNGFIVINDSIPLVIIDKSIIESCQKKKLAEQYFHNKITGIDTYNISRKDIGAIRKELSYAVYEALKNDQIWVDGLDHDRYLLVSDELLPDWNQYLIKLIKENGIYLEYFTDNMFISPDKILLPPIDARINSTKHFHDLVLLFFLKKNIGEKIDLDIVMHQLREAKYINSSQSREDLLKLVHEQLKSQSKISKKEATKFLASIFGWV